MQHFLKKIRYLRKDQGLKGLGGRGFIFYTSFKKHFLYVRKTRLCFDGDQGLRGLGGRGFFF